MSLRKRPGPRPAGFIDAHFGAEPAGGACPSRVPSLDSKSSQNEKPRDVIQPRWGVYALRKKAERIGSVDASDDAPGAPFAPVPSAFCAWRSRSTGHTSTQSMYLHLMQLSLTT
jgi:hypothetical protein